MSEMIPNKPTLGIRFDIDKLGKLVDKFKTVSYGLEGWKIFWRIINPEKLSGSTFLFDGDTEATLNGHERVWCIAIPFVST